MPAYADLAIEQSSLDHKVDHKDSTHKRAEVKGEVFGQHAFRQWPLAEEKEGDDGRVVLADGGRETGCDALEFGTDSAVRESGEDWSRARRASRSPQRDGDDGPEQERVLIVQARRRALEDENGAERQVNLCESASGLVSLRKLKGEEYRSSGEKERRTRP